MASIGEGDYHVVKKDPCVVHGLSVFLFFRELQKIRPPARKKNGGKLWAGPPTQDEEQSSFTIKTDMPMPMLVYGDSFQWAKYGHHTLPSSIDLTSLTKGSLHRTFWNPLIEFLHTDLDGNLSSTLNPLTASRLDQYLSSLQEGLSETAKKGEIFDQHFLNEKNKQHFLDEIARIALFATQIPLSIFTNLFKQRFEKHPMLESMFEMLQQFYIQMETESDEFHLFAGDLSIYTLRCKRCGQHVTHNGSIGDTIFHAPPAMLYHWNMIEPHDDQIHRKLMLMQLLFSSYDNYVRSSNSFFEGCNWMEDLTICQKPNKHGQSMFCEAVKVDMETSKKSSFHYTITSTLSLITVLFEDSFEASTLHREFSGKKVRLEPSTSLLNKTNRCDGHDFNIGVFTDEVNAHSKKNHWCCLRGFVSLVTGNSTIVCFVF
jgi:hypothetical protein